MTSFISESYKSTDSIFPNISIRDPINIPPKIIKNSSSYNQIQVSVANVYKIIEYVFHRIFEYLDICQKYPAAAGLHFQLPPHQILKTIRRGWNTVSSVWDVTPKERFIMRETRLIFIIFIN